MPKSHSRKSSRKSSRSPSRSRKSPRKSPRRSLKRPSNKLQKEVKEVHSPMIQKIRPTLFAKISNVIAPSENATDPNDAANMVTDIAQSLQIEMNTDVKLILIVFARDVSYLLIKLIEKRMIPHMTDVISLLRLLVIGGIRRALIKNIENYQLRQISAQCSLDEGPTECVLNNQADLIDIFVRMFVREILFTARKMKLKAIEKGNASPGPLNEMDVNMVRKDNEINYTLKLLRL